MKTLYIALGTLSLALGILGIFLPLLPTTPFLLLTAALYFKSSPRLYNWLLNHKHLGPYIRNFRENKAIPLRAKIISISLMWHSPHQKNIIYNVLYASIQTVIYDVFLCDSLLTHKKSTTPGNLMYETVPASAPPGARTLHTLIKSQVLYQMS